MRELLTREVAKLLGVKPSAMKTARDSWGVEPFRPGYKGTGNSALWTPMQALALLAGKALRKRGVAHKHTGRIVELLWAMTAAELQTAFDEGRTCFLVVGEKALARLVHKDAILSNETIPYATLAALGVNLWALNLEALWQGLTKAIADLPEPKRAGLPLEEACQ